MTSCSNRRLALAGAFGLVAGVAACTDEMPSGPRIPALPRPLLTFTQPFVMGQSGSFNIPSPLNNDFRTGAGALGVTSTGLTLPAGISYIMLKVTSTLKPITSAIYKSYYSQPHQEAYLEGQTIPPAGLGGQMSLVFKVGGEFLMIPGTDAGVGQWSGSVKVERTASGAITVERGGWVGASSNCPANPDGTNPCGTGDAYWWEFNGQQVVELSFFGVEARNAPTIQRGQPSIVSVGVVGDGVLNYVQEWYWMQDNGWWTYFPACRYMQTCSYTPTQPGHWEVDARINGVSYVRGRGPNVALVRSLMNLSVETSAPAGYFSVASQNVTPSAAPTLALSGGYREGAGLRFTAKLATGQLATVLSWSFDPDDGAPQTPCAPGVNPCETTLASSGIMTVRTQESGEAVQEDQERVTVDSVPCPTGDSILDIQAIRDSLRALFLRSDPLNPDGAQRREQTAFVLRRNGDYRWVSNETHASATPCTTINSISYSLSDTLVAVAHSHPFDDDELLPAIATCYFDGFRRRRASPWPSPADRESLSWLNLNTAALYLRTTEIVGLIIDPRRVIRYRPHSSERNDDGRTVAYEWNPEDPQGCRWFAS